MQESPGSSHVPMESPAQASGKSALSRMALLGALLTVSWFALDWLFSLP